MSALATSDLVLTAAQARLLHLGAQGLLNKPGRRAKASDVLTSVQAMQLLQIDTINVVARSPYLVLFSRLGDYRQEWLDQALSSGALFEVWAHEACFAASDDFVLHRSALAERKHWSLKVAGRTQDSHRSAMDRLIDQIREHGAVKASDFERSSVKTSAWWGWKDEKRWLEACFALGELMIARRVGFQRVYDLPERVIGRVLPDHAAQRIDAASARCSMILRSIKAIGVSQPGWVADYFRLGNRVLDSELNTLREQGELIAVRVEGWDASAWVHRDHADLLARAAAGRLRATHACLLSPFDPLVWDRARASVMFGFDYRLECYTPAPKRRFGYFCLPILCRGRLVGRLDAKAHRQDGIFEIKALHLEAKTVVDQALVADVGNAILACARWHRCEHVQIVRSEPRGFARMLTQYLLHHP